MLAVWYAMILAKDLGFDCIVIEFDCSPLITKLNNQDRGVGDLSSLGHICDVVRELGRSFHRITLQFRSRKWNIPANLFSQ